jgi:hypothetical protein
LLMKYLLTCLTIIISGCYDDKLTSKPITTPQHAQIYEKPIPLVSVPAKEEDRFIVERVQVVYDDLAFGKVRGVYLIKDKKTGQEFIGVSGIGITETQEQIIRSKSTYKTTLEE